MKNCVVAGDWVLENVVGVQRYTFQILCEIDKLLETDSTDIQFELLIPENANWNNPFKKINVVKKGIINSKVKKHIWQQITFPLYVKKRKAMGIDLAAALPIWGCRICAIHDCIHEAYPENFADHKLYQFLYLIKVKILTHKDKVQIVTLTNDSKHEIQKYYKVPESRLNIVSCGWEHMETISEREDILKKIGLSSDDRFFFSLGSRYKHKNYIWVLHAAKCNPQYKFVITGTDSYSNTRKDLDIETPQNVIFTGYITDEEIKTLYRKCIALIQPSLYEGFGLPPLEALAVGGKAIVSKASCLPEIYGEAVYYIDPYSYDCKLDELLRKDIESSDAVLQKYTWKNSARQLMNVINKV